MSLHTASSTLCCRQQRGKRRNTQVGFSSRLAPPRLGEPRDFRRCTLRFINRDWGGPHRVPTGAMSRSLGAYDAHYKSLEGKRVLITGTCNMHQHDSRSISFCLINTMWLSFYAHLCDTRHMPA